MKLVVGYFCYVEGFVYQVKVAKDFISIRYQLIVSHDNLDQAPTKIKISL